MYKQLEYKINHIYGQLLIPDNKNIYPLVIISHGFNGTYNDNINYAYSFAKEGIACYLFDYENGSLYSQSGNNTTYMSLLTLTDNLSTIINHFIDSNSIKEIFLMGESLGGFVTLNTLKKFQENIKGCILLYPAINMIDNAHREYSSINKIPKQFGLWGVPLGECFYKDIYELKINKIINQIYTPTYIIHGDKDFLVPLSYSTFLKEKLDNAELKIIHNVGHGFYGNHAKYTEQKILEFIKKTL